MPYYVTLSYTTEEPIDRKKLGGYNVKLKDGSELFVPALCLDDANEVLECVERIIGEMPQDES